MATFTPVVSKHKRDDGSRNVQILVYHKYKKRYPSTNYYLSKDDLTKLLNIKNQLYTDELDNILKKCRERCNDHATAIGAMDIDEVVELIIDIIEGREEEKEKNEKFYLDIVDYGDKYIKYLEKKGHNGNAKFYRTALNNLVKFAGRDKIDINEITTRFVNDWVEWIRDQPPRSGRKKGERAESLYPNTIKSLHNIAKNEYNQEEAGIIRIPFSPFKKARIPKTPEKKDRALPINQIRDIFALKDEISKYPGTNKFNFARDMFMLSFMLIGMNLADLYTCADYRKGRVTYYRTKVKNRRTDKGIFSVKVEPEVIPLMEKYKDPSGERIFCFYKMYSSIETFTMAVNGVYRKGANGEIYPNGLKKVGEAVGIKGLEHYAARHSWATITRNDVGIDKYTVHEALNHVVEEMKSTDIYLNKSWALIDQANRATLDYVFEKNKRRKKKTTS